MADNVAVPQIDEARLNSFGQIMFDLFGAYERDRKLVEERLMKNLRQVKGVYDPEIENMIPGDRSKAYPRVTAYMCKGTIARLLQIAFPQTEKNFGVKASPLPDLSKDQLQQVLDNLVAAKAQGGDPTQVELSDEEIEKGITEFAAGKAVNMEKKCDDDLMQMEYITLARRVVRSGVIYGYGVLEGPLHEKVKARTWQRNQFTGKYEAIEVDKFQPVFEFLPVWNWYPDLTATHLTKQDGSFKRVIMTRQQVEELADRPDFLADRITEYLRTNESGNYRERWWESLQKAEPKSAMATVNNRAGRKYEAWSWWGAVKGFDLRAAGVTIPDADVGRSFHANVWGLDGTVIKCRLAPLGGAIPHYHVFVYEEDDLSILGGGLPDTIRDSQLSICEVVRAALDNASVVGPMVEINDDLLTPGQNTSIAKHKTWRREGEGQLANVPAVRNITIDSHIVELKGLLDVFMDFVGKEAGLPPASIGDTAGGGSEALRTTRNASMFLGAAALPIRDTMRNFDIFTISLISALIAWNTKYDPNPSRDGDHDVIARGSTSLIAKEVLAQQLLELSASLAQDPEKAANVNKRKLLIAEAKANDLPLDEFLASEDEAKATLAAQAQAAQTMQEAQLKLVEAQVQETLTKAFEHVAKAEAEKGGMAIEVANTLLAALKGGHEVAAAHDANLVAAHQADTARKVAEKPVPAKAGA